MNSYNFFEPYIEPPKPINYERLAFIILVGLLSIAMMLAFFTMQHTINDLNQDIELANAQTNDPKVVATIKEINQMNANYQMMLETDKKLSVLDLTHRRLNNFDLSIFEEINRRVPRNVFVERIQVAAERFVIIGYGEDVAAITLFSHQLNAAQLIEEAKVKTMEREGDNFRYEIEINAKELSDDIQ